jgi:hypothetical protein
MLLKKTDSKDQQIAELQYLLSGATGDRRYRIEQELRILRAGIKGEQEAAYLIDFSRKESRHTNVIHDLRLEIDGQVAQIDHLIINQVLYCYVLETKHFSSGFKITEEGEFLRWNDFRKCYEGMPSPLAQNERHLAVLKKAFERIEMPTRFGIRLPITFFPLVLVSPNARIDRPKRFDTSQIIKADMLEAFIDKLVDKAGVLDVIGGLAKVVSIETLEGIGKKLVRMHKPTTFDYTNRFGCENGDGKGLPRKDSVPINPIQVPPSISPIGLKVPSGSLVCRHCGKRSHLSIQHGRYGYFMKCSACDGNSPIRISCGKDGHKERIRKEGLNFYRECPDCNTSAVYFINPASGKIS